MQTREKSTGHTPGPWQVSSGMVETVAEHSCKIPGCGVHIPIAYMDRELGNGTMPVERDYNAKLIAAARPKRAKTLFCPTGLEVRPAIA